MHTAYITDFAHHTTLAHAPAPHKLHLPAPDEKPAPAAPAPPPHPTLVHYFPHELHRAIIPDLVKWFLEYIPDIFIASIQSSRTADAGIAIPHYFQ